MEVQNARVKTSKDVSVGLRLLPRDLFRRWNSSCYRERDWCVFSCYPCLHECESNPIQAILGISSEDEDANILGEKRGAFPFHYHYQMKFIMHTSPYSPLHSEVRVWAGKEWL